MKYLEIRENKVYFINCENIEKDLDVISKEDILFLLDKALEDDFEFDDYEEGKIGNQVHDIIYKNIESKIKDFIMKKSEIDDEIQNIYKEAYEKYCN